MKKIFLASLLIASNSILVNAQCDKKFTAIAAKAYSVNADKSLGAEMPLTADMTFTKDSIFVTLDWQNDKITKVRGAKTSTVCNMNNDYSEGTIDWKVDAEMKTPETTVSTKMLFTIESKAGQMKIYGSPEDKPEDKICFVIKDKPAIK